MRIGYALGSSSNRPSLGTAAGLLVYDNQAQRFEVWPNPGLAVPPGQGQRPAAIRALHAVRVDTVLVRPGALCPDSYHLARELGLRFAVVEAGEGADAQMTELGEEDTVEELAEEFYQL